MARPQRSLQFICRSCQSSIRKSPLNSYTVRTYTTTQSNQRSIPTFTQSVSDDLNAIFTEFRDKVFIPASLSKTHRALMYKKSRHYILRNDPGVSVTLSNDEEFKLEPSDRWHRPNKHKSLGEIVRILGSDADITAWENLPKFLEGMTMAKEKIPVEFMEKITRKANEAGRAGLIRRCVEMVTKTGFKLSIQGITRELFLGIHTRAVDAQLKGKGLTDAINEAEGLVLLMEKEDHCAGQLTQDTEKDMRRDLTVMAVLLELEAAKALDMHQGKDQDGKVTSFARRLQAISQNGTALTSSASQVKNAFAASRLVEQLVPVSNALRMALRVSNLGATNAQPKADTKFQVSLKQLLDQVDDIITTQTKTIRDEAQGKPRRALMMLEAVQGV